MTDTMKALTAESMPMIRKTLKVGGLIGFVILWLSAMFMTLSVMLGRAEAGDPWYIILGLVALGIGADFWVGAAPVILRTSANWGVGGWVWVGWCALVAALLFSFSNKLAYWEQRADARETAAIVERVDTLATQRALVEANPHVRVPDAVRAERDGVAAELSAKRAELAALPDNWLLRRREAAREIGRLERDRARLDAEFRTADAVARAQADIDARRTQDALVAAQPERHVDALVEWIIAFAAMFGATITAKTAEVWMHAGFGLFHEMFQFVGLGLATLRIPVHKLKEENEFLISQRRLRTERRVQMVSARITAGMEVKKATAHEKAMRRHIPTIAAAESDLEVMRIMRDIRRRRREFELEGSVYDLDEKHMVPDLREDKDPRSMTNEEFARQAGQTHEIQAEFVDAARSMAAQKGWATRRAKANTTKEVGKVVDPKTGKEREYEMEVEKGSLWDGAFRQAAPKATAPITPGVGIAGTEGLAASGASGVVGVDSSAPEGTQIRDEEDFVNSGPEQNANREPDHNAIDNVHTPSSTTASPAEEPMSQEEMDAFVAMAKDMDVEDRPLGEDGTGGIVRDVKKEERVLEGAK